MYGMQWMSDGQPPPREESRSTGAGGGEVHRERKEAASVSPKRGMVGGDKEMWSTRASASKCEAGVQAINQVAQ